MRIKSLSGSRVFLTTLGALVLLSGGVVAAFPRFQDSALHFAVVGDGGEWNEKARSVHLSISRTPIRRLVMPGDNLYIPQDGYASVWRNWLAAGFSFDVVAIGNHRLSFDEEIRYFGMPGEYYEKVIGPAAFYVLNSDNEGTAQQQARWLDQALGESRHEFRFVVLHHPPYAIGNHDPSERARFQAAFKPVLWKHRAKVTALLVGHDHIATFVHYNDLPVVLSGAVRGIKPASPRNEMKEGVRVRTEWLFDGTPHWVRMEIHPEQKAVDFHYIRAADSAVRCSVRVVPGSRGVTGSNCQAR